MDPRITYHRVLRRGGCCLLSWLVMFLGCIYLSYCGDHHGTLVTEIPFVRKFFGIGLVWAVPELMSALSQIVALCMVLGGAVFNVAFTGVVAAEILLWASRGKE